MIGAGEIQNRKSTLKKTGSTKPLPEQMSSRESGSTNSSVDSADGTDGSCTGGQGTGECTGDSGFADASTFLKVRVASSQPTVSRPRPSGAEPLPASGSGYYETLGALDSVEGYTTVTSYRDNSNADQAGEQENSLFLTGKYN